MEGCTALSVLGGFTRTGLCICNSGTSWVEHGFRRDLMYGVEGLSCFHEAKEVLVPGSLGDRRKALCYSVSG